MSIVTMNPAKVSVQLLDINNLTHQQIFKLAHLIDAYEIDKQLQDKLVIDILKVTRSGWVELILTPKTGLTYDELSEHLDLILKSAPLQIAIIRQDTNQTPGVLSSSPDFYTVQTSYWSSFNAFTVGDLNGDGRIDLAVLDPGNNGTLNLFYQNIAGNLDTAVLSP